VQSPAVGQSWRFREPSVLPGFGLTFGYSVLYLSLIVLLPMAALVAAASEATLDKVLQRGCWTPVERFGTDAGWHIDADNRVALNGVAQGTLQWELLGEHNRQNALAAIAAARHVGVPVAQGLAALAEFKNVKRRMEVRGVVKNITVYDDFGKRG